MCPGGGGGIGPLPLPENVPPADGGYFVSRTRLHQIQSGVTFPCESRRLNYVSRIHWIA